MNNNHRPVLVTGFVIGILSLVFFGFFMSDSWRLAHGYGPPADDWFYPYELFNAGVYPYAVGVGDFNNDGLTDVSITDANPTQDGKLHIFRQNLNGSLQPPVTYDTGYRPDSLAVGDINDDGRDDIVVAQFGDDIGVFLQQPNGTLADGVFYSTGDAHHPDAITIGDFNDDTRQDVAISLFGAPYIGVFYQDTGGTLDSMVNYPVRATNAHDMAAGDFNDDGRTDIVQSHEDFSGQGIIVFLQQETGGFTTYDIGPAEVVGHLAVGDFNTDGRDDVALSYYDNTFSTIQIYLQSDTGILSKAATYDAFNVPEALSVGDINLDGRDDLIAAHSGEEVISLHLQLPDGTMAPYELYPTPFNIDFGPTGSAVADINNDGLLDALFANHTNGLIVHYHGVPDFDVTLEPPMAVIQPGQDITYTVTISRLYNYSGTVTLSMVTLPSGATHNLPSGPFVPPAETTFTLTPNPAAPIDFTLHEVTIEAADGKISHASTAHYSVLYKLLMPAFYRSQ